MKRLFFAVLLVLLSTQILTAEARPITLPTGEKGFFLTREDMEKATFALESRALLLAEIEVLKGIISSKETEVHRWQWGTGGAVALDFIQLGILIWQGLTK